MNFKRKDLEKMSVEEKTEYLVRIYEWNCGIRPTIDKTLMYVVRQSSTYSEFPWQVFLSAMSLIDYELVCQRETEEEANEICDNLNKQQFSIKDAKKLYCDLTIEDIKKWRYQMRTFNAYCIDIYDDSFEYRICERNDPNKVIYTSCNKKQAHRLYAFLNEHKIDVDKNPLPNMDYLPFVWKVDYSHNNTITKIIEEQVPHFLVYNFYNAKNIICRCSSKVEASDVCQILKNRNIEV